MIRALLALLLAAPAPAPTTTSKVEAGEATAAGRTVVADGHVDMGARFVDGVWSIQVRDDTVRPSVWRNLPDVVWHAVDAARTAVPSEQRFAFLGQPGTAVWVLPQAQRPGVLWPGWNTQDPQVATTIDREVTWRLHGVQGPGTFALFLTGNFGEPQVVFDGTRPMPQEAGIEINTHVHGNWVFTQPGRYLLDVEMSGTTTAGRQVTDRDTLRIFVGPGDPTTAFATVTPSSAVAVPRAGAADEESTVVWPWIAGAAVVVVIAVGVLLGRMRRRAR